MEEYIIEQLGIDWSVTADIAETAPFINDDGSFDPDKAESYYE
jgi:hypothetical protein